MSTTTTVKITGLSGMNVQYLQAANTDGRWTVSKTTATFQGTGQEALDSVQTYMDWARDEFGGQHRSYRSMIAVRNKLAAEDHHHVTVTVVEDPTPEPEPIAEDTTPEQANTAEAYGTATGATAATMIHERVEYDADGTRRVTEEGREEWTREAAEVEPTLRAAQVRGEFTYPHATADGEKTLCGSVVADTSGDFELLQIAGRCPYCHRAAALTVTEDTTPELGVEPTGEHHVTFEQGYWFVANRWSGTRVSPRYTTRQEAEERFADPMYWDKPEPTPEPVTPEPPAPAVELAFTWKDGTFGTGADLFVGQLPARVAQISWGSGGWRVHMHLPGYATVSKTAHRDIDNAKRQAERQVHKWLAKVTNPIGITR